MAERGSTRGYTYMARESTSNQCIRYLVPCAGDRAATLLENMRTGAIGLIMQAVGSKKRANLLAKGELGTHPVHYRMSLRTNMGIRR